MKRLALLIACFLAPSIPRAADPAGRLTEPEIIQLSLDSMNGDKSALRRLKEEYRDYRKRVDRDEPLTDHEKEMMLEMEDTLRLQSPEEIGPTKRSTAGPPRSLGRPDFLRYLDFREGDLRLYGGSERPLDSTAWKPDGRTLRQRTLEIVRKPGHRVRIRILQETLTHQGQWVAEQAFLTFWLRPGGLLVRKEIVYSQPEPKRPRPLGWTSTEELAEFPVVEGRRTGPFTVEDTSATVRTEISTFTHCAVFRGVSDAYVFAPGNGLVRMEEGSSRWTLKEKKVPAGPPIPARPKSADRRAIKRRFREREKQRGWELEKVLSFQAEQAGPATPDSGDPWTAILLGKAAEKDAEGYGRVTARALVSKRDETARDQKLYDLVEISWVRQGSGWEPASLTP